MKDKKTGKNWSMLTRTHLLRYINDPPLMGVFLNKLIDKRLKNGLEEGCFSARDSIYLAKRGRKMQATDSNLYLIQKLRKIYGQNRVRFSVANAIRLSYPNNSFDFSFSDGLIGCFKKREMVRILREQYRVTRYRCVIAVHNSLNSGFFRANVAAEKRLNDGWHNVRFFSPNQIRDILKESLGIADRQIDIRYFYGDLPIISRFLSRCGVFDFFHEHILYLFYHIMPKNKALKLVIIFDKYQLQVVK
jgi:hypothetical protein